MKKIAATLFIFSCVCFLFSDASAINAISGNEISGKSLFDKTNKEFPEDSFESIELIKFQPEEKRNLRDFHSISVQSGIDVYLRQDKSFSVEVVSDDDDLDDIITEVSGGVLKIYYRSNINFPRMRGDKVYLRLPELKSVKCSGGSDVVGEGLFKCSELNINSSGGSDVKLTLDVSELVVDCSGGADVVLDGTASKAFIEVSGGADFKGYDFEVSEADLNSSGGSDIEITVKERIKAKSSGGSDIYYKGDPEYVEVDSSGGSDIHKR